MLADTSTRRFGVCFISTVVVSSLFLFTLSCSHEQTPVSEGDRLQKLGAELGYDDSGRVVVVSLQQDRFTDAEMALVPELSQLKELYLARSQITDNGLQHVKELTNLRLLVLPSATTDLGLAKLEQLPNLRELMLVDTQVTDSGLKHLSGISSLERLALPQQTTDAGLAHLTELPNLETLDLSFTGVTDALLEQVARFRKLKDLKLFGTQITDSGLAHVYGLSKLKSLDISFTNVSDQGVSRLQQALPNLEVVRTVPNPVARNSEISVGNGFQGDVHPLLNGETQLEVTARWTPIRAGRDEIEKFVPKKVSQLFRGLKVAKKSQTYTQQDFSAFLPEQMGRVGEIWELDLAKVAGFLKQFHGNPSMRIAAAGRRAGPDGGFATLRAVSPTYFDVRFRVHAEFKLSSVVWYTPAYFRGRLLINRETGTVEYFRLGLPPKNSLNVHLTAANLRTQFRHIVHVHRMEMAGGNSKHADDTPWTEAIEPDAAHRLLERAFYRFMDIEWVPVERALAQADASEKPIMAIVLWGALDNQSC